MVQAEDTPEALRHVEAEISGSVMSPYCPGRLLRDCPSGAAQDLRNQILSSLQEGKDKEKILEELYTRFGTELRAVPEGSGIGLLAWGLPPVFLILGLFFIFFWIRRNNASKDEAEPEAPVDAETLKRIEDEVHRP
jgi:cytochrome c-type biogenesis protein CcmH/NrfF